MPRPALANTGLLPHDTGPGGAIRALGTPGFPACFALLAGSAFGADQVIVFQVDGNGRLRTLLAESRLAGTESAQALAATYTGRFWPRDPNHALLLPGPPGTGREVVLQARRTEDLPDGEYRHRLFTEPQLGAKASVILRTPGCVLYVNLYRGIDRAPFSCGELDGVAHGCDLLLALLEKHFALADGDAADDLGAVQRVIEGASAEPGRTRLSAREAAVCARIAAGHATEAIRQELGVSQHSVISYRRRAYEKLGVATQKELFALVLRRRGLFGG